MINTPTLQTGPNVFAVELHQSGTNSSDAVLSVQLVALVEDFTTRPTLTVSRGPAANQLTLSWNGNYCVEEAVEITPTTTWTPSAVQNGVPFTTVGPTRFYRLVTCGIGQ